MKTKDPTGVIRKGSDNAITPGLQGGAEYLELAGTSLAAGGQLVDDLRGQVLEVSQCVSPDPDKVAAAGSSSVAQKMIFRPMLGRCDILRVQYGAPLVRLLDKIARSAGRRIDAEERPTVIDETTNEEVEIQEFVDLPPRAESVAELDEAGAPTGKMTTQLVPRVLGPSIGTTKLKWPDYFKATSQDTQAEAGALTSANGGLPLVSHQSSVESFAETQGRDPAKEWALVKEQMEKQAAGEAGMFPSAADVEPSAPPAPAGAGNAPPEAPEESEAAPSDEPAEGAAGEAPSAA